MLSKYLHHAVFAASVIGIATAQESQIVPQELQAGFTKSAEVQVSYTGDAVNGFQDGDTFEKDQVANVPEFALGDSSGISRIRRYTVLMVDTTCNTRVLHYARTNFKNTRIVQIESETDPVLVYKAPGSFGETGDDRKYSFLLYRQPEDNEISDLKLPGEGEPFDFTQFQNDNGFEDPTAGVGMIVKLGGQSDCGSGGAPPPQQPQSSSEPEPASSSAAAEEPSATPSRTPAPSQATSANASATSGAADAPQSTGDSQPTPTGDSESSVSTAPATGPTTNLVPASSAAPSTLVLSSSVSDPSATETSGEPAQQTTSGAQALSWQSASLAMAGSIFAFAGLFV